MAEVNVILEYNFFMHTTNLRKVGGSTMMAVPPAILNLLQLQAGATVAMTVDQGRLLVMPTQRPSWRVQEQRPME
jgi:antitoxin ChpS